MERAKRPGKHLVGADGPDGPPSLGGRAQRESKARREGRADQPEQAPKHAAPQPLERVRKRQRRHAIAERPETFRRSVDSLRALAAGGATVSLNATDATSGQELLRIEDTVALPTAGVGKVLLLIEVAAQMGDGAQGGILDRSVGDLTAGGGLWQHLQVAGLPMADLAVLVAATGDSLATNALLDQVGLDAVRARAESLGLNRTALLDRVRENRGPDDAPQLSVGSGIELVILLTALSRGEVVDGPSSERVLAWMAVNTGLSLVASAFGLDPLSHGALIGVISATSGLLVTHALVYGENAEGFEALRFVISSGTLVMLCVAALVALCGVSRSLSAR